MGLRWARSWTRPCARARSASSRAATSTTCSPNGSWSKRPDSEDTAMAEPRVAPYGSWRSPISSDLIASATIGLGQIALDGEDVYWAESRPAEGGRIVVVRRGPNGEVVEVTPAPFNARTRVHEYGGGAFVVADGTVYFSNFADQRIYRVPALTPRPLPEGEGAVRPLTEGEGAALPQPITPE